MSGFKELVICEESDEFIGSHIDVESDDDGYFIRLITDPHDGCAQITLPAAKALIPVLQRAIAAAEKARLRQMVTS